jgi:hypothetical protein
MQNECYWRPVLAKTDTCRQIFVKLNITFQGNPSGSSQIAACVNVRADKPILIGALQVPTLLKWNMTSHIFSAIYSRCSAVIVLCIGQSNINKNSRRPTSFYAAGYKARVGSPSNRTRGTQTAEENCTLYRVSRLYYTQQFTGIE